MATDLPPAVEAVVVQAAPLTLRAGLRYESARYDDLNSRRLAPCVALDVRADLTLAGPLGAFISVENLLDAEIGTGLTADGVRSFGPPRLIRAGLTVRR